MSISDSTLNLTTTETSNGFNLAVLELRELVEGHYLCSSGYITRRDEEEGQGRC